NPPTTVMLQWNDGTWEHRAYWGTQSGVDGPANRFMGPRPALGQWVRLEVPAALVGLEGRVLNGMAFTLVDGRATWDRAGKASAAVPTFSISGTVTAGGAPLNGVSFAGASCTPSNPSGQY